jgi:hypothetical protein
MLTAGALAVAAERLWLAWDLALWVDETWTGTIVSQPGWRAFMREVWLDPNAPLYSLVMRLWTALFGLSNLALRAPSLLFAAAAAALPLLCRMPGLSFQARAAWGALIFFWIPGIIFSLDARGYALLLLLSVAQTILYARLLEAPSLRWAAGWALLAGLAILTHYYALCLAAVQGLLYLAIHRRRALATWPAALAFLPAFAWCLHHLPRLLQWTRPELNWYNRISWETAWELPAFLVGPVTPVFLPLLLALMGGIYVHSLSGDEARDEVSPSARSLGYAVATGAAVLLILALLGTLRPLLTVRYLTPIVPLALLGLVLAVRRAKRAHLGYLLLAGLYLLFALKPATLAAYIEERGEAGYEEAAEFLIRARPDRLVFAADAPGSWAAEPHTLAETGTFFFRRAGVQPKVVSLILRTTQDPNPRLLAQATGARPAILWFYVAEGSAAAVFPPSLNRLRPDWACFHRRRKTAGVIACAPRHLFPTAQTP